MQEFLRDITIYLLLFVVAWPLFGALAAVVVAYAAWCGVVRLESLPPMRLGWRMGRLQLAMVVAA